MSKRKTVISIAVCVVAFAIAFVAGYYIAVNFFTDDNVPTNTDAEQTTAADEIAFIPENEVLGEGELAIGQSEYYYYCVSVFDNLCSTAFQYDYYYGEGYGLTFTGYDYKKFPSEQAYTGETEIEGVENPTYLDYIEFTAKKQLHTVKAYVNYAKLNGITLNSTELAEIDAAVENARESVSESEMTLEEYLKKYFGENMTEEIFKQIVEDQYIVNKVDGLKSEQLGKKYTEKVLEGIYNENTSKYGVVTVRDYTVSAETTMDEDGNTVVSEEAMKEAKAKAEQFFSSVSDEDSFKKLASDYELRKDNQSFNKYITDDSYTLLEDISFDTLEYETGDYEFAQWVFSADRKFGDKRIVEIENLGYVVYMVVEPVHKVDTTYTYDVRHVLFEFPETKSQDAEAELMDTSKYDAVIDIDVNLEETGDPALYMEAQSALIEYLEGERTEESFGELAKKYSSDGNAQQGGIYEAVTKGYMVAEFENWAYEEGRQYGDVGIVETEFGYHIMYFIKKDVETSWQTVITDACVYDDVIAFSEELIGKYEPKVEGYDEGYDQVVRESINKLVEQNLEYYKSLTSTEETEE